MNRHSVLRRARIDWEPYPHVVVREALPWSLYNELEHTFPQEEILKDRDYGHNVRIDMHAKNSYGRVNEVWREFIDYHTSHAFWEDVVRVFEPAFNVVYPHLINLGNWSSSVRGLGPGKVQLECQPGVNTPTRDRTRVRGPHLDNPIELFGGLLYMGSGEGDLWLYRYITKPKWHGKLELDDACVEPVGKVKYAPNTLVMFVNSYGAIHGVSPRGPDENCRRLVSIAGEVAKPLFHVGHGKY